MSITSVKNIPSYVSFEQLTQIAKDIRTGKIELPVGKETYFSTIECLIYEIKSLTKKIESLHERIEILEGKV